MEKKIRDIYEKYGEDKEEAAGDRKAWYELV